MLKKNNIIQFKPNQVKKENPFSDVFLDANLIPVNYSDIAMQLGLSPYTSANIDYSQKPVNYSDIAMPLGLSPYTSANIDYSQKPVNYSDIAMQLGLNPIEYPSNADEEELGEFMDTDRAEAMIMQLLGGDENALSSIRTRDINRDTALRSAVATERNDAIAREFNENEKNKQKAEQEAKEKEEKNEKILKAEKDFNDAKASLEGTGKIHSNDTEEFKLALNNYNEKAKLYNNLIDDNEQKIQLLDENYEPKDMPLDKIENQFNAINANIEDVKGIFAKNGGFTDNDRKNILEQLDKLKNEPNCSKDCKNKIDELKNKLNKKISIEQQRKKDNARNAQKQLEYTNNKNNLVSAIKNSVDENGKVKTSVEDNTMDILKKFGLVTDNGGVNSTTIEELYSKNNDEILDKFKKKYPKKAKELLGI